MQLEMGNLLFIGFIKKLAKKFYRNIQNKVKQIREFKNNADIRVLLLNIKSVASGTNLIEATHIIFMGKMIFIIILFYFFLYLYGKCRTI